MSKLATRSPLALPLPVAVATLLPITNQGNGILRQAVSGRVAFGQEVPR
jgi:hypothetical protein